MSDREPVTKKSGKAAATPCRPGTSAESCDRKYRSDVKTGSAGHCNCSFGGKKRPIADEWLDRPVVRSRLAKSPSAEFCVSLSYVKLLVTRLL